MRPALPLWFHRIGEEAEARKAGSFVARVARWPRFEPKGSRAPARARRPRPPAQEGAPGGARRQPPGGMCPSGPYGLLCSLLSAPSSRWVATGTPRRSPAVSPAAAPPHLALLPRPQVCLHRCPTRAQGLKEVDAGDGRGARAVHQPAVPPSRHHAREAPPPRGVSGPRRRRRPQSGLSPEYVGPGGLGFRGPSPAPPPQG